MGFVFRTIGACSRTISQAMAPSAVIILILIIFTGFTIPTRNMLGWSRWINYVNPIAYAVESLMINEFDGKVFPCDNFILSGLGYENVPSTSRVCATTGAAFGSNVVQGAKPGLVLFLDGPTSGLDSQTAWSICVLLRKLANNGQAILCTIHQPSALLFQSFVRLLFLQNGGQNVYFEDISENC
jgi:ABC-2 type transporter/CDR ABC transporter